MRPGRAARLLAPALAGLVLAPAPSSAQDVEMLGRHYGTPVPDGYRRARQADASAFEFRRGWGARGVRAGQSTDQAFFQLRTDATAATSGPRNVLGPRSGPVEGTFRIPVVLGLFSNSGASPPFTDAELAETYFGAGGGTITDFYDEMSFGRVELLGDVFDWVEAPRPDTAYTVDESGIPGPPYPGLGGGGAWNFIWELLELHDGVDWGLYDNDGPDGVPNSGDDDGFVDVLGVIHPMRGGECGGSGSSDRIWSHRWSLSSPFGTPFTTTTPSQSGGFIRIDDYTIQPSTACSGGGVSEIGVFAHELGHAFGLPDLYDTNGGHSGAGSWDLMSSGSWGCGNATPQQPCHMGAWSKSVLGWVDVVTIDPGNDLGVVSLPPVESSDTVFRVDAQDGSGDFFLIENRQRIGYDLQLPEEGLLIWRIDQALVDATWPSNRVNAGQQMGVWLVQADGEDDLGSGRGRGDPDDPFPGRMGVTAFHAVSDPPSLSSEGGLSGLTMADIAEVGDDVTFRLTTRMTELTVRAGDSASAGDLLTVDGQLVDSVLVFSSAPFVTHELEAAGGEPIGAGVRRGFLGWSDGESARRRTVVTPFDDAEYIADYGGLEFEAAITLSGGVAGVEPATFTSDPVTSDLWFPEGAGVTLTAVPRTGFAFSGWSGALAGQANPATFVMDAPFAAGADFDLVYAVAETSVDLPAATNLDVQLEVEQGTAPVRWSIVEGALPLGVALSSDGRLTGASLDLGRFDLTVEAVDALGLPATGAITLNMTAPSIPIEELAAPFLLNGAVLEAAEINFLGRQGNGVPGYDLGDFRSWVLSDEALPLARDIGRATVRMTVRVGTVPVTKEEPR